MQSLIHLEPASREGVELMRSLLKNMKNHHKTWSNMDMYKEMAYRSTMLGNFLSCHLGDIVQTSVSSLVNQKMVPILNYRAEYFPTFPKDRCRPSGCKRPRLQGAPWRLQPMSLTRYALR